MNIFKDFFRFEHLRYKTVKGGSVLEQIRAYNKRTDCVMAGTYTLCYPISSGNTCGEFVQLCAIADAMEDNKNVPYKLEDVLKISNPEKIVVSTFACEPDIRNKIHLIDLVLEPYGGNTVTMKFFVDLQEALIRGDRLVEHRIKIPFTHIPMLQFVVDVEIGTVASQKMMVSFLKGGEALICELSTTRYAPNEGG